MPAAQNAKPGNLNVLGTNITPTNEDAVVRLIESWLVENESRRYVCVTGVHGVMESLRDVHVRHAHNNADLCVPDGMPLTWLGRHKGWKDMDRVYGPNLMLRLLEQSNKNGFTNYYYGGKPGIAEDLKSRTQARFPSLEVVGTHCPPFRPLTETEQCVVIDEINACMPDILWVGLSTPKQELLMAAWHRRVNAKVMIGVGAAFDFHTGRVSQAPGWIQRAGLEWLFRTCMEPRRLARRYIRNNPAFIFHLFLQLTGLRKYSADKDSAST